jgi:LysM repeat protein
MATGARRRHVLLVVAGSFVLGLLAACGSESPDSGSSGTGDTATTGTSSLAPMTTPPTTVPGTTTTLAQYYEVQAGDTLSEIAENFNVRLEDLIFVNQIADANKIQTGQRLLLPPPTVLVNPDGSTTTGSAVAVTVSTAPAAESTAAG